MKLSRYHDCIVATVTKDGAEIPRASRIDPEPISGSDIQYVVNMNLAKQKDGEPILRYGIPGDSVRAGSEQDGD